MGILKERSKLKYKEPKRIVLRDKYRSVITPKEIHKFRAQARAVQEDLKTPKLLDQSLDETLRQGAELMKQNGFVIACEAIREL